MEERLPPQGLARLKRDWLIILLLVLPVLLLFAMAWRSSNRQPAWTPPRQPPPLRPGGRLPVNLLAQERDVVLLQFSSTGRFLVTVTTAGEVRLWDTTNATLYRTLTGDPSPHVTSPVYTICFSADDKLLATNGIENEVHIWEIGTGKLVQTLRARNAIARRFHISAITADTMDFSRDNRMLYVGNVNGNLQSWDVERGEPISSTEGIRHFEASDFTPDRKLMVGVGEKGALLLGVPGGETQGEFGGRDITKAEVRSMGFSDDGRLLITAGGNRLANVWDRQTGERLYSFAHADGVNRAFLSPDKSTLITTTGTMEESNRVYIWDIATHTFKRTIKIPNATVVDLAPDGVTLVTGGEGRGVGVQRLG